MSTPTNRKGSSCPLSPERPVNRGADDRLTRRSSIETKAAFKTTELIAYVAMLIGIFVAGFVTSSSTSANGTNPP